MDDYLYFFNGDDIVFSAEVAEEEKTKIISMTK